MVSKISFQRFQTPFCMQLKKDIANKILGCVRIYTHNFRGILNFDLTKESWIMETFLEFLMGIFFAEMDKVLSSTRIDRNDF